MDNCSARAWCRFLTTSLVVAPVAPCETASPSPNVYWSSLEELPIPFDSFVKQCLPLCAARLVVARAHITLMKDFAQSSSHSSIFRNSNMSELVASASVASTSLLRSSSAIFPL